jgi:hypothetical protein
VVAHSETIVRNHSATACSELVVESQTGRVATSGWRDGITVENSPTPHLSRIGNETSFASSGASQLIPDGKPTFHSQSDRDAIDHVRIIVRMGISQQLSERQDVSALKLHNQADRFRVRRHSPGTSVRLLRGPSPIELFFYQAEKGKGITPTAIDMAIAKYEVKKAQLDVIKKEAEVAREESQ